MREIIKVLTFCLISFIIGLLIGYILYVNIVSDIIGGI